MALSPSLNDSEAPAFVVTVEGKKIDSDRLVAIETWNRVNRVPRARLVFNDGDPATGEFTLSASDDFLPGKKLQIAAGYDGRTATIFSGVIVRQGLDIMRDTQARLVVELADPALKMTLQRKNGVIKDKSDHDLVAHLISDNGLDAGRNEAPSTEQEAIVQHHASDWDMLVTRAEANGLVVLVDGGKVEVVKPDTSGAAVLKAEYGDSLLDLEIGLDARDQVSADGVKSRAWSYSTQAVTEGTLAEPSVTTPGNVDYAALAKVFGLSSVSRQSAAMLPDAALNDWASAELRRARLAKVRGQVRVQGSTTPALGKMIELVDLGPRFSGKAYISGVQHSMAANRWLTTVEFGLATEDFAHAARIADAPAAGLLPPVGGLQTGIVKQVAVDEVGDFRVLVTLPLLGSENGVWARLAGFHASNGFGAVFYPEIEDEVILAFMGDDPRSPVILGSVYSAKHAPALPPNKENDKKAIVTRSKIEVTFDDKDVIFEIKTPGGHSVTLNDKTGQVVIKDSNSNSITLGKTDIVIDGGASIHLTAKGDITLKAGGNLDMQATANASLKAVQIKEEGSAGYVAKGGGTAEFSSGGLLTVKGAMVKIN